MSQSLFTWQSSLAVCVLASGIVLSMAENAKAQGDLFRARQVVRSGADDDDDHRKHRHRHYDDCDDDDDSIWGELLFDLFGEVAFEVCCNVATSPFWGPHQVVDQGYDVPGRFYHHPYDRGVDGLMEIGCYDCPPSHLTRFDVEYALDFDDLERVAGNVLWEHSSRIGVDASVNFFQEDLGLLGDDQLWIGDANVVYRFAQCENFVMRAGVGVNWLADDVRGDAGINFTYGADWFPAEPLVVSTVVDWGTLGDAEIFHGRATVGIVREHVEIYTGYDYYDIDGVGLGTVIAGLRVWF